MILPLLTGLKITASIIIALQDIRTRLISIYLLIGLFMLNFIGEVLSNGMEHTLKLTGINTLLIGLIFGLTFLYFKLIRKVNNPLITHLGWGDIMFFLALTPLFYPIVYSYVFIAMTLLSTIVGLVLHLIKSTEVTIPHAGISALSFILTLLLTEMFSYSLNSLIL